VAAPVLGGGARGRGAGLAVPLSEPQSLTDPGQWPKHTSRAEEVSAWRTLRRIRA
jgi:hypothetical protein